MSTADFFWSDALSAEPSEGFHLFEAAFDHAVERKFAKVLNRIGHPIDTLATRVADTGGQHPGEHALSRGQYGGLGGTEVQRLENVTCFCSLFVINFILNGLQRQLKSAEKNQQNPKKIQQKKTIQPLP